MAYNKTIWVDDSAPYIDSTNLNNIEDGIAAAHAVLDGTGVGDIRFLGSTEIPSGEIRSGEGIDLTLSAPAEDLVVVVEKQHGMDPDNEQKMAYTDIFNNFS